MIKPLAQSSHHGDFTPHCDAEMCVDIQTIVPILMTEVKWNQALSLDTRIAVEKIPYFQGTSL